MLYDSQDCLATIPPYPHYIGDRGADYDVASSISDQDSMWIVCPQHFFKCTLRPLNATKHDMLAGQRISLGGCHSFRASLTATPPLPFLTSMLHDRSRPSNLGVPTVKALHHAWAAMFMRSTHGCGTLAGPSLELEGYRSQKQKRPADSTGLKHPGALGRPGRPASLLLKRYFKHIPGIHLAYKTAE